MQLMNKVEKLPLISAQSLQADGVSEECLHEKKCESLREQWGRVAATLVLRAASLPEKILRFVGKISKYARLTNANNLSLQRAGAAKANAERELSCAESRLARIRHTLNKYFEIAAKPHAPGKHLSAADIPDSSD
jgi:oligoendopeptidase F